MQTFLFLLGLLPFFQQCHGHWTSPYFIVNGTQTPAWKYVRNVDDQGEGESGKMFPIEDVTSKANTCGTGAVIGSTSTAAVVAGSEVGFKIGNFPGLPVKYTFVHPGPVMAYLSRAPNDDIDHYDGSGDWFKIYYAGPTSNTTWTYYPDKDTTKFTIPKTTPPGKYLLRQEYLFPWPKAGTAQFYINCAQIEVVGPGGGKPTEFAKFPGTYKATDPGILVSMDQYNEKDLLRYTPPGPPVWQA